jgi:signal transduction histidine kinase
VPIVIDGHLRGHVEIAYNLENIRAQLADNFRKRLFALLGVFALGLAVMLVLTRNATRPLDALADGAAQVAEGRLDVTVPVDRDDEIGRLASTFNYMTEKLRERQELEVRLAGAEKRAEIGHLASGLAHEIKNPLNALSLGLDVLRRRHRPDDEAAAAEYGERIEALREEINRLAILINNFLAYGRPLTLVFAPTDLADLVRHTLSDLAETAVQAHVTIEEDIPDAVPLLRADANLLKSSIWNLVQNGIQAMERHGGLLRVHLSAESGIEESGRRLVLSVEDEGPGIPETDLPRLFDPYFSKKEGGVGLGLAMVKRIVEEHGGRVTAGPRGDGLPGATFRVSLPAGG